MAIVIVHFEEFLQFVCWTAIPPGNVGLPAPLCEGSNGYFTALRIKDVEVVQGSSFSFDPRKIFASSAGKEGTTDPPLFPNPEKNIATVDIDPTKGLTFKGSGKAPMVLVRDVFVKGHTVPGVGVAGPPAGAVTAFSYDSKHDTVLFNNTGPVPVPAHNEASTL
ncbi:MAG TPA: hypothetical protein VK335_02980 [Bryobacteraceae bacterium]|nr:hypothetical protein [Bryobacteraceae bacterium]